MMRQGIKPASIPTHVQSKGDLNKPSPDVCALPRTTAGAQARDTIFALPCELLPTTKADLRKNKVLPDYDALSNANSQLHTRCQRGQSACQQR